MGPLLDSVARRYKRVDETLSRRVVLRGPVRARLFQSESRRTWFPLPVDDEGTPDNGVRAVGSGQEGRHASRCRARLNDRSWSERSALGQPVGRVKTEDIPWNTGESLLETTEVTATQASGHQAVMARDGNDARFEPFTRIRHCFLRSTGRLLVRLGVRTAVHGESSDPRPGQPVRVVLPLLLHTPPITVV